MERLIYLKRVLVAFSLCCVELSFCAGREVIWSCDFEEAEADTALTGETNGVEGHYLMIGGYDDNYNSVRCDSETSNHYVMFESWGGSWFTALAIGNVNQDCYVVPGLWDSVAVNWKAESTSADELNGELEWEIPDALKSASADSGNGILNSKQLVASKKGVSIVFHRPPGLFMIDDKLAIGCYADVESDNPSTNWFAQVGVVGANNELVAKCGILEPLSGALDVSCFTNMNRMTVVAKNDGSAHGLALSIYINDVLMGIDGVSQFRALPYATNRTGVAALGVKGYGCIDDISVVYSNFWSYRENIDGTLTITGADDPAGNLSIPSIINGRAVTSIGYSAFSGCDKLTSVTIPDGVETIMNWALSSCTALTNVIVGSDVAAVGDYAFFGCYALQSLFFRGHAPYFANISDCLPSDVVMYVRGDSTGWGSVPGTWEGRSVVCYDDEAHESLMVDVAFDLNYYDAPAEDELAPKSVVRGNTYGELPSPGTRDGFVFTGWALASKGGAVLSADTTVLNANHHTLHAQWRYFLEIDENEGWSLGDSNCWTSSTYGEYVDFNSDRIEHVLKVNTEGAGYLQFALDLSDLISRYGDIGWVPGDVADMAIYIDDVLCWKLSDAFSSREWAYYYGVRGNAFSVYVPVGGEHTVAFVHQIHYRYRYDDFYGQQEKYIPDQVVAVRNLTWQGILERERTISLDAAGGVVEPDCIRVWEIGEGDVTPKEWLSECSLKISLPTPSREGYAFDDWYTEEEGGVSYTTLCNYGWPSMTEYGDLFANGYYHSGEDIKMYAHWTSSRRIVDFVIEGSGERIGGGELSQTVELQSAAVAPEIVAYGGWEFAGWDVDFSCVVSNMTVHALWRRVYAPDDIFGGTWSVATNGVALANGYDDATAAGGISVNFTAADDASVWVETVVSNICRVSFDWKCSCEPLVKGSPYDYLAFTIDGERVAFICGETDWTCVTNYVAGEGEHRLCWMFQRDEDGTSGEDCAWLANVSVVPAVTLTFADGGATASCVPETMTAYAGESIVMPGPGTLAWPKHSFLGWSDGSVLYGEGDGYLVTNAVTFTAQWATNVLAVPVILAPATYEADSATVTITADAEARIYYTLDGSMPDPARSEAVPYLGPFEVVGSATIRAIAVKENYFDSEVVSATVTRLPWTLGEYLNWPEQTFTAGGNAEWARTKGVSDDGYALRSGTITHSQTSRLETVVSGAGTIRFSCRVEGEIVKKVVWDGLAFCIDGVQQGDLIGDMSWTEKALDVTGVGLHTLSWLYVKDEDGDGGGEDCAWLDAVVWTPAGAADLIPAVAIDTDAATVNAAVDGVGFADEGVKAAIGGSAAEYAAFKEWAGSVKGAIGGAGAASAAGEAAVVANTNAAAAWLLGAERLFENAPVVEIGEVAVGDEGGGESGGLGTSRPTMTVSVTVKDGEEAVKCAAEKMKAMFEATGDLGDWVGESKMLPTVTVEEGEGATMRFKVTPGDGTATRAFLRIRK